MELRVTAAELIALFLQSLLYSLFVITFGFCMRALLLSPTTQQLKSKNAINWMMLSIALILAFFATFNIALEFQHCLDAFVYYEGSASDGVQFGSPHWLSVMQVRPGRSGLVYTTFG
jgi:uncharacterized membrane protein